MKFTDLIKRGVPENKLVELVSASFEILETLKDYKLSILEEDVALEVVKYILEKQRTKNKSEQQLITHN